MVALDQRQRHPLGNPTVEQWQWFDVSAFPIPAPYTHGNATRNTLSGPGMKDLDAGLLKSITIAKVSREAKVECRGAFFNATHTPPFGLPDADAQDSTAGRVLNAGAPPKHSYPSSWTCD